MSFISILPGSSNVVAAMKAAVTRVRSMDERCNEPDENDEIFPTYTDVQFSGFVWPTG
jgi:hypothetical protein